jgi:hypothetical protein
VTSIQFEFNYIYCTELQRERHSLLCARGILKRSAGVYAQSTEWQIPNPVLSSAPFAVRW